MGLVAICGACNTSIFLADQGLLNYGDVSSSPEFFTNYHVNFTLPFDGYISNLSVSTDVNPFSNTYFSVTNLDSAITVSNLLALTTATKENYQSLTPTELEFSAGDRILVYSEGPTLPGLATILVCYCEITSSTSEFICITSSSRDNSFINGDKPFSFGAGVAASNGGVSINNAAIRLPVNTNLKGVSISANESGAPLTSDAVIALYNGNVKVEEASVLTGNLSGFIVYGGDVPFNRDSSFSIECETTAANIDHIVVTSLFEIL